MCRFYKVSRSGYYAWKNRSPDLTSDMDLVKLIEECQAKHKRRYGYRRVALWLQREKGLKVNHKRVLRVMGRYNLLSIVRRRRLHRYVPNGNLKYANVLSRDFYASRPNQKWVTDISYICTPNGVLYVSAIRDLFDNFIVAYKTAKRQDYSLVEKTIKAALDAENPQGRVILHSDGGGQYRSYDHKAVVEKAGFIASMSAPATPADNACAENFFSILKTECIHLERPHTPERALGLTREFIDYYNYERIQTRSGLSPYAERRRWYDAPE
jgi:transposase InsO family protein